MNWGITMVIKKDEKQKMTLCRVVIHLKNEKFSYEGWTTGENVCEVTSKLRTQSIILLASTYRSLKEAGWNMSECKHIDAYNSEEIVRYHVEEYTVIKQTDNDTVNN